MSDLALQVEGLGKVYDNGKTALHSVDLEVPAGSFYALLGPNGAGKSTLINILADIGRPSSGCVRFFGHDVFSERAWCKRRMGIVPQEAAFDPFFTPREVLRLTSGMYGKRPDESWIDQLLDRLELTQHARKNTRQLSGGMRRRLLVAQALVHRPQLVVLDEPTAGVDVELRQRLWAFMRELNRQGTTILLTTHYLEEAEELCDRVAIIHHGRMIADRPMKDLMREVAGSYLWLRYGPERKPSGDDLAALESFHPRIMDDGICMTLQHPDATSTTFHAAYSAAVARLGAPLDASVRAEDLEDVFLRLTRDEVP